MDKEWEEALTKAMDRVWAEIANGTIADKLSAVSNALFLTVRASDHGLDDKELITRMALLSGVASGVMHEAAELLRSQ